MTSYFWTGGTAIHLDLLTVHRFPLWPSLEFDVTFERALVTMECQHEQTLGPGVPEPQWAPTVFAAMWQAPGHGDDDNSSFIYDGSFDYSHWVGVQWEDYINVQPLGGTQVTYRAPHDGRTFDITGRRTGGKHVDSGSALVLYVGAGTPVGFPSSGFTFRSFWMNVSFRVLVSTPE